MPKYNIELRTADRVWDTFQFESDDLTALRVEMAQFIGELLRDHAKEIWTDEEWRVDATDEKGLILFVMSITASNSAATMRLRR